MAKTEEAIESLAIGSMIGQIKAELKSQEDAIRQNRKLIIELNETFRSFIDGKQNY